MLQKRSLLLALVIGLMSLLALPTFAQDNTTPLPGTIRVSGTGSVNTAPDTATVIVGVTIVDSDLKTAYTTANDQVVYFVEKVFDDQNFIADFCPTHDRGKGFCCFLHYFFSIIEFGGHHKASTFLAEKLRDNGRGCMRPMCCSESIVYIDVAMLCEFLRKFHITFFFLLVEAAKGLSISFGD